MTGLVASAAAATWDLPVYLAVVLAIAIGCQWLAWALRVPSLLVLLVAGFALGQWQRPEDVMGRDVLFAGVSLMVGIILFEGSLSLRFRELRGLSTAVVRLCTSVVAIAFVLVTGAAVLVGVDVRLAVLLGALLVVTGPTVINPILRQMRPTRRVSSLLRWEGIVVDPIGAVLAVLGFQVIVVGGGEESLAITIRTLATTLVIAAVLGVGGGLLLGMLVRRHLVPDHLQAVVLLATAVAGFVASDVVAPESGLLTVTVLGITLANQPALDLHHVREFKEHLQVLFVGALFVVLAGRVTPEALADVAPQALALLALLVLVVRPVSIFLGLLRSPATRQERTLLAFMAPRGIVAAAVTSIFALEFQHAADRATDPARVEALTELADEAQAIVPIVFVVIVGTVALYGLGVGRLAERLGLAKSSPQGVLFAGTATWLIEAAAQLKELGVQTLVVGDRYRQLAKARMRDLPTVNTNIVSEYAIQHLELGGIGTFVGATDVDSTNSQAAREFAHILGRKNSWQLRRADDDGARVSQHRQGPAQHLVGRYPFSPAATYDELAAGTTDGLVVRRTRLTDTFTYDQFREQHPDAVVMFAVRGGRVDVVTEDNEPTGAAVIVALMRERDPAERSARKAAKAAVKSAGQARRAE